MVGILNGYIFYPSSQWGISGLSYWLGLLPDLRLNRTKASGWGDQHLFTAVSPTGKLRTLLLIEPIPMTEPLRILTSASAWHDIQSRVHAVMGKRPYLHVDVDDILDQGQSADVAFISREVTGLSTKFEIMPETQRFYDALVRSTDLRWLHVHSAGADRPVYQTLMARGVTVTTSSGANAKAVAHSALAGILSLARKFPQLMRQQQEHRWQSLIGERGQPDLDGQTAVIVGWGGIGQTIAKVLTALEVKVIVVRRQEQGVEGGHRVVPMAKLHSVLPEADWLVLACPLTNETHELIDRQALQVLKPGAHVVNIARGAVVEETALIEALQSGQVGGAYLDVFAQEPLPPSSPLWDMPTVIATPHSAGHSQGMYQRMAQMFIDNLQRFVEGDPLQQVANDSMASD